MMLADVRAAPGAVSRRTPAGWRHFDYLLAVTVTAIACFGCLMVYTATRVALESNGEAGSTYLKKQALFTGIGVVIMVALARIDYRRWRDWGLAVYGFSLFLLLAVLGVGHKALGSQEWFQFGPFEFEPSEFAKAALVVGIAAYASRFKGQLTLRGFLTIVAMTLVPFGLVYKQPDLGTALVMLAILIVMLLVAGARLRHLLVLILVGVVGIVAVVELGVLHKYQEQRLVSFADTPAVASPSLLQTVAGANIYNVVESKNAISHGGVLGQGIGKGSATNLSQVPEQQTDFIFSAAGEQVGLVGSALLLLLFLMVIWRSWQAANSSRDLFGTLLCVGVVAWLVFQVFENVGMTMGIMPVAGIPLPWMSYGGSAEVMEFVAVGLVLSVRMHRFR
jgi:rod shape determining protein RodA